jgi:hypothetical protein
MFELLSSGEVVNKFRRGPHPAYGHLLPLRREKDLAMRVFTRTKA